LLIASTSLLAFLPSCGSGERVEDPSEMKVLVLGMDGLDPILLSQLMSEDRLPNFSRLAALGSYSPFGTAMPPQSPVAWSNFISGSRPGTHQIFDWIHRKPNPDSPLLPIQPYMSTSEALPAEHPDRQLTLGKWRIPLDSGEVKNLRRGDAFWNHLVKHGVSTTIYRMPANYPPEEAPGPGEFKVISGMGTPDLLGTQGEFFCFRENMRDEKELVAGGHFARLDVENDRTVAKLEGPENYLLDVAEGEKPPKMTVELEIVRDPIEEAITVSVGDEKLLLKEGEWSNWIPIAFETGLPGSTVVGAAGLPTRMHSTIRLYVREVHPYLDIYVSPLQIDPFNPANPISYPPDWSAELAELTGTGGMYTTGIPEDTKALRSRPRSKTLDGKRMRTALDEDGFLQMARLLVAERTRQYHDALEHFKRGFLYFYFGHTDQLAHIFWRDMDPLHPGRKPGQFGKYDDVIFDTYEEMDARLGEAFEVMDDHDVLIVMSDHGFCSFRRGFNVNNWLVENGYMTVKDLGRRGRELGLLNIRFDKTQVYAVGLNCLYINLKGREKYGIVAEQDRRRLMEEVAAKLELVRDEDGSKAIEKVYFTFDDYPNADPEVAPDMLIGYTRNYRGSWATALGGLGRGAFEDNRDRWSGDHCISANLVPGIIVSNMELILDDPELSDLGPSLLRLFGIEIPETMLGRNIFGRKFPLPGS
jgi:predicted AlkP superfamily phosphohydrolase/phosphomutase